MARESMILVLVVAGLIGLWLLYQICWCFQSKVTKVKRDVKRMKEMKAQDLPATPRYPIFSATAGIFCVLEVEENEENNAVRRSDPAAEASVPTVAPCNTTGTSHTYKCQGAYIDELAPFIDLEANIHDGNSSSSCKSKRRKKKEKRKRKDEEQRVGESTTDRSVVPAVVASMDTQIIEVSDLSEASSACEKSADEQSISRQSEIVGCKEVSVCSEEHSYATTGWYDLEPSDEDDVVYSISSEGESGNIADKEKE